MSKITMKWQCSKLILKSDKKGKNATSAVCCVTGINYYLIADLYFILVFSLLSADGWIRQSFH